MGRYGLRQLCVFVLACGVYFGGMPHMYSLGDRATTAGDFAAFAFEAILAWLLLAAVYIYWRQLTPLAVHLLCVALSLAISLSAPNAALQVEHFFWPTLGRSCWAGILISFPISLGPLALSAVLGRRIEPLTNRLFDGSSRTLPSSDRSSVRTAVHRLPF